MLIGRRVEPTLLIGRRVVPTLLIGPHLPAAVRHAALFGPDIKPFTSDRGEPPAASQILARA